MSSKLPTYDLLMNPVLHALRALGGSGEVQGVGQQELKSILGSGNVSVRFSLREK